MIVIGLTGGAGAGKDEAVRVLKKLGADIIDADKTGHRLLACKRQLKKKLVRIFSSAILDAEGRIDRGKLGTAVFGRPSKIRLLNRAIHPLMAEEFRKSIKASEKKKKRAVVLNAAILFEAGWDKLVDRVVLVASSKRLRVERLAKRGISREKAMAMAASQWPDPRKAKRSDIIIKNNSSLKELHKEIKHAFKQLIRMHSVS